MRPPLPRRRPTGLPMPAGFTLTEILIALALVALLLVGISRIFAITSTTISSGQALAKSMRSHKAIQTSLSNDFLGVGDLGQPDYDSGMMPLVNTADSRYAAPFLSISNFRVAAYKNQADFNADSTQPIDFTALNAANFANRSAAIRNEDLNKNGTIDAGEVVPLYSYGERNFRADTIGFFAKGRFDSQTGSDNFVDIASSNEAWIWYGHLRVFNSDAGAASAMNGYGSPGDQLTIARAGGTPAPPPGLPNRNNRFADEFRLGRVMNLLIEPTDVRYDNAVANEAQKIAGDTVVANRDPTRPLAFILRDWATPTSDTSMGAAVTTDRRSMLPILPSNDLVLKSSGGYTPGQIYKYLPSGSSGQNRRLGANDQLETQGSTLPFAFAALGRSDIAGSGISELRARAAHLSATALTTWWDVLPNDWDDRYFANPFPALPLSASGVSQRSQILADACSQFVVEFAGDFVTQAPNGTVGAGDGVPDGILDFVAVDDGAGGFIRQTRWYGLPRDVDGDGIISATAFAGSPDVIPVRDVRGGTPYAFERRRPTVPTGNNYLTELDEPGTVPVTGGPNVSANGTAYVCVWGPEELKPVGVPAGGVTKYYYAVPRLIRIIADLRDPNGTLKDAVTQEFIFPVRVTASIEPPKK